MSFWAYVLRCADDSYYTGHTDDLERRIAQHESGALPGYTHDRRPVTLMWSEAFSSREEAVAAELRVKNWSRAKKEALFRSDWTALSTAAKARERRIPRHDVSTSSTSARDERHRLSDAVDVEPASSEAEMPRRATAALSAPAIILVRPQLGANIGKAARAMLNFGLTDLRLVSPRDGWPNPDAGPAASGADIVLEQARVFDDLASALADCTDVYATTVRRRGLFKPVLTPEAAAGAVHAAPGRAAFLFGPERSGLDTDDVAVARAIVTVPINPEFGSLNLAQAVILIAYEWSKQAPHAGAGAATLAQPTIVDLDPPAEQGDLDGLLGQLDRMLEEAGYFFPPDHVPTSKRTIRSLLTKPGWSAPEVRTMRGVLSALDRPRRRRG